MPHSLRLELPEWRVAVLIGALSAMFAIAAPVRAHAGLFDFFFGGAQQPPADVNSYAEPPPPALQMPSGRESVRSSGSTGHAFAFCVRLCDGQHFPLEHLANATPVEACQAMCPASKTKVFFGSEIDHATARDGAHYADLDTAFMYRQIWVANCSCNGKDAFGLAHVELARDPTLRPGDIVATQTGFEAFAGKHGETATFTPVNPSTVTAELNGGPAHVRLTRESNIQAAR